MIEQFSFRDEIAMPTEFKAAPNPLKQGIETIGLNAFDFDNEPEPIIPTQSFQDPEPVIEDDYNAEENASSLVYTLTALDSLLLSFAVQLKCRSNVGGAKMISKMKSALQKEMIDGKLTDHDKVLIDKFKEYKSNMQLLSGEITPNKDEIQRLIDAAVPYCEQTKFKIGGGTSFWINYVASAIGRASKIMMP